MEIYNVNMAILHQALTLGKHSVPAAAFSAPRGEKCEERRARESQSETGKRPFAQINTL